MAHIIAWVQKNWEYNKIILQQLHPRFLRDQL